MHTHTLPRIYKPEPQEIRDARERSTARWRLKAKLAAIAKRPRLKSCGCKRIANTVQVQVNANGKRNICGVETCASVWSCPPCACKIYTTRASDVQQALRLWRAKSDHNKAYLLTLTIRHEKFSSLRTMVKGIANAWRRFRMQLDLKKCWGIQHMIRALEVTHGQNGWHPHLHIVLFADAAFPSSAVGDIAQTWGHAVLCELGVQFVPDQNHGVDVRISTDARYVAKLGLEIQGITAKAGKAGSRTPWQIATSAADGDEPSAALWLAYCEAMFGRRQLTWTRGTRVFFGLGGKDSDDIACEHGVDASEGVEGCLVEWAGSDWDANCKAFPRSWLAMVVGAMSSPTPLLALLELPGARLGPSGVIRAGPRRTLSEYLRTGFNCEASA